MTEIKTISEAPVIYCKVSDSPVFAISVCIKCGSRDEKENEHGLTHFFEHMIFKGTKKRNAEDISSEIEALGGELDAFTTRDNLCITCKVPYVGFEKSLDVVFDMLLNSVFREKDIQLEKQVVKEELRMAKENHDDSGDELFMSLVYPERELGRSILGNEKSIDSFTRKQLFTYAKTRVCGRNLIVSGAGKIDEEKFFALVKGYLQDIEANGCVPSDNSQPFAFFDKRVKRDGMDGVNLYLGFKTFPANHKDRFALSILNNILGDGMSSRLFLRIREEAGLAYSISSFPLYHRNEGMLYIFGSTSKGKENELKNRVIEECLSLGNTIQEEEFEKAKGQLIGNLSMGLETSLSKSMFNARNYGVYQKIHTYEQIVELIEQVDFFKVKKLAEEILIKDNFSVLLFGNV